MLLPSSWTPGFCVEDEKYMMGSSTCAETQNPNLTFEILFFDSIEVGETLALIHTGFSVLTSLGFSHNAGGFGDARWSLSSIDWSSRNPLKSFI